MDRRRFLKAMGATAGASAAGGLWVPPSARAGLWGSHPDDAAAATALPEDKRAKNVLEIFLYGGLCPWETFYVVPEYGTPEDPDYPDEQWWTFQSGEDSVTSVLAGCGLLEGHDEDLLQPFVVDELGAQVHLGPNVMALRDRPDIAERLRVMVLHHELEPHEAAIPLALSGRPLGSPKMSGLGSMISYYYQVRSEAEAPAPFGYVLYPTGVFPTDNLRAASAVGFMPASSRPLSIKLEANSTLAETLARGTVGPIRPEYDALVAHYAKRYADRYTWPGAAAPMRSPALTDYQYSLATLQNTDQLAELLSPELLAKQGGETCGDEASLDTPGMGMKIATYLLTRQENAPRYVCLVDGGLIPASGGGGYDTHDDHNRDSTRNLHHTLTHLTHSINAPGEDDPDKLNLDETLIILNTEFGRTPYPQNGNGRNHHPYAYTTVMFGGPIGADQKGLVGSIGPDSLPGSYVTPAEFRAAALVALGIWPFEPQAWAVGDIRGAGSEVEAANWLRSVVLGHA